MDESIKILFPRTHIKLGAILNTYTSIIPTLLQISNSYVDSIDMHAIN